LLSWDATQTKKELEAFHAYEQDDSLQTSMMSVSPDQKSMHYVFFSCSWDGNSGRDAELDAKSTHHVLDACKADGSRANRDFQSTTTR
jgi:hypothetical protein